MLDSKGDDADKGPRPEADAGSEGGDRDRDEDKGADIGAGSVSVGGSGSGVGGPVVFTAAELTDKRELCEKALVTLEEQCMDVDAVFADYQQRVAAASEQARDGVIG